MPLRTLRHAVLAVLVVAVVVAAVVTLASPAHTPTAVRRTPSTAPVPTPTAAAAPLEGKVVALDPGHQLGNGRFPAEVNRLVDAGGLRKPCNTVGTATDAGLPEATVTFRIAERVAQRLEALGADVRMTRAVNSPRRWGPCVDARGTFGGRVGADLTVSIHADGAGASLRGFHVIVRESGPPALVRSSLRLAHRLRAALDAAGVPRSDYVGDGTALSRRDDLGTLNLSTVPVVMVELGNMRNPADARLLSTRTGESRYVDALVEGVRRYLDR